MTLRQARKQAAKSTCVRLTCIFAFVTFSAICEGSELTARRRSCEMEVSGMKLPPDELSQHIEI